MLLYIHPDTKGVPHLHSLPPIPPQPTILLADDEDDDNDDDDDDALELLLLLFGEDREANGVVPDEG